MSAVAGPFYAAAGLLGVAGALKLLRPQAAMAALRAARLPASASVVGLLGAAEVALAAVAVIAGTRHAAVLVVAAYAGFTAFVARQLRRADASPCGCLGDRSTPVSAAHLAVNLSGVAAGVLATIDPPGSVVSVVAHQPLAGLPFLVLTALAGCLTALMLTTAEDTARAAAALRPSPPGRAARRAAP